METTVKNTIAEMSATELRQFVGETLNQIDDLQQANGDYNCNFAADLTQCYNEFEHIFKHVSNEEIVSNEIRSEIRSTAKHLNKIRGIIDLAKELAELTDNTPPTAELTDEELAEEARAMCSILSPRTAMAIANEIGNWLPKEANLPKKRYSYFKHINENGMLYIMQIGSEFYFVQKIYNHPAEFRPKDRVLTEQMRANLIDCSESDADTFNYMLITAITA